MLVTWAAQRNTWLLTEVTLKGVVSLFFCFHACVSSTVLLHAVGLHHHNWTDCRMLCSGMTCIVIQSSKSKHVAQHE